jgi:hypothetical protein
MKPKYPKLYRTKTQGFAVLDYKLKRLAKSLSSWTKNYIGDIKKQMLVGEEIILRLDTAQEVRQLTVDEKKLRSTLKARAVGLAVINRVKARQRASQVATARRCQHQVLSFQGLAQKAEK